MDDHGLCNAQESVTNALEDLDEQLALTDEENNDTEGEDSLQVRGCTLMKTIAVAPQFINKDWILNIITLLYSCGVLSYGRLNSKEQKIMSFAVRWMPYVLTYWQILTSRTHLMPLHFILTGESGRTQLTLKVISFLSWNSLSWQTTLTIGKRGTRPFLGRILSRQDALTLTEVPIEFKQDTKYKTFSAAIVEAGRIQSLIWNRVRRK